jgi:hypothetical protein|tara:strand:- start:198 stop:335 length:138 start_codon:yes stop_codon:yes gene_type:complete
MTLRELIDEILMSVGRNDESADKEVEEILNWNDLSPDLKISDDIQ